MKVAYVVPRYGIEVVGGAELAARMLAERLAAVGWSVEVFTTCARDSRTWADEYPEASLGLNGVTVHRFRSRSGRDHRFEQESRGVLHDPASASGAAANRWVDLQGPVCPAVLDAAASSSADIVVFCPYLYWPTVRGVPRFASRSVLHPAAHDELPIKLPIFRDVFSAPGGLAFFTESERRLAERLFPEVTSRPQAVVGLGVERGAGTEEEARAALGLSDRPYIMCLGRVDDGKGTGLLARWFAAYKKRRPGPLALVLAGPVLDRPPPHPDILLPGVVDEAVKWGALDGAAVVVLPSAFESFSIALMEAWIAGRPALVNGACETTKEHCLRSGGGLWFWGYGTFEAVLDRLLCDRGMASELGHAGRSYVDRFYTWPRLIARYQAFLRRVESRATGAGLGLGEVREP